jgi:hypothetical protein
MVCPSISSHRDVRVKRNNVARNYTTPSSNVPRDRNCLYFGTGDHEHELRKFYLCWAAKVLGHEFITEARGKDGKVVDFVDLDEGLEVEVETGKERAKRFEGKESKVWEVWHENNGNSGRKAFPGQTNNSV